MTKSEELLCEALRFIPWGTQTNAKRPIMDYAGVMPFFIEKAKGCRFWDVDGREFIDYRMALGPVILGYCYEEVDNAVKRQIDKGVLFSMASPLEIDLAKRIVEAVPSVEMVRFMKNGVDANACNIRLARAFTGRDKIIRCGYNGYHDWFMTGIKGNGVPEILSSYVYEVRYGDLDEVEKILKRDAHNIACILTVPYDFNEDISGEFPRGLRNLADEYNVILIFDEVLTGFRLSLGGAQGFFEVKPDLSSFAKAMANGYPISAYGGRRDIMKRLDDFVLTATYAGETLSIVAAIVTIDVMRRENVHETLFKIGRMLMSGFIDISSRIGVEAKIGGLPVAPFFLFNYTDAKKNKDLQFILNRELFKKGIFVYDKWFISFSHSESDISETLDKFESALKNTLDIYARENLL
ncbi:glutamate-1-semialdehyde 2,1-aminomutase [Candidatus Thermokryptus mobilis]|uniref:Glutamate-1-semialdehyde 2,1-aminomutase n=1 Tax=Candidatus Thermokryptus mobilis TaxID=1643428 RepID=A0A0S4NAD5_9BACT|nr:aminotransferase class III-fold pyridoxal phosphate-dependent enzyme [Candidatus Thermokryptus mobilis]CUU08000.1 glutamate-1-semialdehyde 2,1-aminomutase [Candidatus Thermokryptus mobilis]